MSVMAALLVGAGWGDSRRKKAPHAGWQEHSSKVNGLTWWDCINKGVHVTLHLLNLSAIVLVSNLTLGITQYH